MSWGKGYIMVTMGIATGLMVVAGGATATSNYFFRRSIDRGGTSRAFLAVQLALSCVFTFFLHPVRIESYGVTPLTLWLGLIAGLILTVMLWGMGRALEVGPPAFTLATMNAATLVPAILMACVFGGAWGHPYTLSHWLGSVLVLMGLFWAGWDLPTKKTWSLWGKMMAIAFVAHVFLLCFLEWRALLVQGPWDASWLVPFRLEEDQWLLPVMFGVAALVQAILYWRSERRIPHRSEVAYGILGGVLSGTSTSLLMVAPVLATPIEQAMIYPLFAVTVIGCCHLWARGIYRESVNWKAQGIAMAGLLIGLADWRAFYGS